MSSRRPLDVIKITYDLKALLNHLVTAVSKGISLGLGGGVSLPQDGQETQHCAGGPIPAQAGRGYQKGQKVCHSEKQCLVDVWQISMKWSEPANAHVEVSRGEVHGKAFLASVVCQMRGVDEHTQHHKSNANGCLPLHKTGNNMTSTRRQLDSNVKSISDGCLLDVKPLAGRRA